jgi:hypothetical protein
MFDICVYLKVYSFFASFALFADHNLSVFIRGLKFLFHVFLQNYIRL